MALTDVFIITSVDAPHVSNVKEDSNVEGRNYAIGAPDGSQRHDNAVELHPGWSYKEIEPKIAGQFDDVDRLYHIPDDIFNRKRSNNLMEHANKGTLKPELYSRSRTAHGGIAYISGTTTFGNKWKYCRSMLFDIGCDFNIVSSWYLRDMLGANRKELVKSLPGHTVTARMATGHASQAIGIVDLEVTLAVTATDGTGRVGPLAEVDQLVEEDRYYTDGGWTTTTKTIEYLVFDGIDLPIINGGPWIPHVVAEVSCHDQAPTYAGLYEKSHVPGEKRDPPNQYAMIHRRHVAPLSQVHVLVCYAQKDTWISFGIRLSLLTYQVTDKSLHQA